MRPAGKESVGKIKRRGSPLKKNLPGDRTIILSLSMRASRNSARPGKPVGHSLGLPVVPALPFCFIFTIFLKKNLCGDFKSKYVCSEELDKCSARMRESFLYGEVGGRGNLR